MKRGILWDMDGTLLDSEPAHEAAFDGAVKDLGLDLSRLNYDTLLGASGDMVHAVLARSAGLTLGLSDWLALKRRHYARHLGLITRRIPTADLAIALAAEGIPMAVVSNSAPDEVASSLDAANLAHVIPLQISRADVAQGKPAPDCYLLAARRLGLLPEDCMVVEDSPTGAAAGLAAGMKVLFHPQTPWSVTPNRVIYLPPEASPEAHIRQFLTKALVEH